MLRLILCLKQITFISEWLKSPSFVVHLCFMKAKFFSSSSDHDESKIDTTNFRAR